MKKSMKKHICILSLWMIGFIILGILIYHLFNWDVTMLKVRDMPSQISWDMTRSQFEENMNQSGYEKWIGEYGEQGYLITDFQGIEGARCVLIPFFDGEGKPWVVTYELSYETTGIESVLAVERLLAEAYEKDDSYKFNAVLAEEHLKVDSYFHEDACVDVTSNSDGLTIKFLYKEGLKEERWIENAKTFIEYCVDIIGFLIVFYIVRRIYNFFGISNGWNTWDLQPLSTQTVLRFFRGWK